MRTIAIIIVLLIWILLGWKACTDYAACCGNGEEVLGAVADETSGKLGNAPCNEGLICFDDNSCDIRYSAEFDAYKDSLLNLVSDNQSILITGIYNNDEAYTGDDQDLGHCRANAIRGLFAEAERGFVSIAGLESIGSDADISSRYRINIVDKKEAEDTSNGVVISRSAVIYFPYNSTNKLNDDEIEGYLREVAQSIKDDGGKVSLVGHTDDKGSANRNMDLGQRRANVVMDYLLGQGVLRSQISAESEGEQQPVASNATAVGRAKNRRVELKIIR